MNKWVLITNKGRYVGYPFITSVGRRSPLFTTYEENKESIIHFASEEDAIKYLKWFNRKKSTYFNIQVMEPGEKILTKPVRIDENFL